MFKTHTIDKAAVQEILSLDESHFVDFKAVEIAPSKLTKTISAFANTSGGELYVGISEVEGLEGRTVEWRGFDKPESANAIVQVLEQLGPLANNYVAEFLQSEGQRGWVLHVTILKTQEIITASDGKVYVRRSAQSLPIGNDAALERLRYEKGIKSFEDEILNESHEEISNSSTVLEFMLETIPTGEPEDWLTKQRVLIDKKPTVAGILLFSDNPQSVLPKRSAIKILRYQTKKEAERDFLAFDPLTMEGPLYNLIYDSVDKVKEIIEGVEKLGAEKMEKISYPQDALHELLTNAVLHRDYNIAADVQVRIFDNRIEIESPGKLPGPVTPKNIRKTQFARNPKLVRLINKFRNPPNKDVGEGLNTAFEAMEKLRLKPPVIEEREGYVVVTLRHESLGSPEQMVMDYLKDNSEITNLIARELTGIKSENSMKSVFYRLRETGQLEQVPKVAGKKPAWRMPVRTTNGREDDPEDSI